jgi:predicted PurR-regulated permease PerM
MDSQKDNRNFFYLLLAFAAYCAYQLLAPYLSTIIFSMVVVVMFHNLYFWILSRVKQREGLATFLTLFVIFLIVLVPLLLVINITISQALAFKNDLTNMAAGQNVSLGWLIQEVNYWLAKIPYFEVQSLTEQKLLNTARDIIQPLTAFLADRAVQLGSSSAEILTKFIIFITLVSSLFPGYRRLINLIKELSPLDDEVDEKYINRMVAMTRSMVKGVFVIAVAQGVTAGLFYWIAGVDYVFFWTLMAIFLSILPLGSHVISIPMGIILFMLGDFWQGIVLLLGAMLIVGNLDNILRPRLVSKDSEMSTALILLSAFGGLNLFGFLGVIYGPVIMIFLITTIEIYLERYQPTMPSQSKE